MVAPYRTIGKKESIKTRDVSGRTCPSVVPHCESYKRCWNISLENQFPPSTNFITRLFRNLQMSDINTSRLPFTYNPVRPPFVGDVNDVTLTRGTR